MIALVRGEVADRGQLGERLCGNGEPVPDAPAEQRHVLRATVGDLAADERDLFLALLGVQAVGPKLALAVLGAGPLSTVIGAIASGDAGFFQSVSGVGRRTAERIIVELREKVGAQMGEQIVLRRGAAADPRELARDGLLELGFAAPEAERLLAEAQGETVEELLATALRATRLGADAR